MATYTSFLNLEKPTTSERLDVLKINANWDKIDAGVSSLNSKLGNIDWSTRGTQIPNNSDLNTYHTPGKYYSSNTAATSTMSNAPVAGGFSLYVIINAYDWVNQYAMPANGQTIKHRFYADSTSTWSEWQTLTFA